MIGLLQKITQRPKDKNIRIGKIIFALILLITLYYNLIYQGDSIESSILGMTLDQSTRLYTKYSFLLL